MSANGKLFQMILSGAAVAALGVIYLLCTQMFVF